jgi:hypothetical protein
MDLIILITLSLLILITRIPFMAKYLFDWDSVGFALSFSNFDISLSQPQSPGYIFFVALGKMVNVFFYDPNFTMIVINIVFSVLTVIVIYFLAKDMFSRTFALIASLLLIFNPIFWFYGEIAAIYMSHALFASLIAYTSYKVLKGDNRFLYISAIVLGLAGGFRQDMLVFMFPLWFFCIIYQCRDLKKLVKIFAVLIISALTWLIPTLWMVGGLENYLLLSNKLFTFHFSSSSVFYGANITQHFIMDAKILFWSVIGLGITGTLILMIYILYKLPLIKLSQLKDLKFIFILLWIIPTLLFYLLIYFAKPGYLLIYLPTFALIMSYVVLNFASDLNRKFTRIPKNYLVIILFLIVLSAGVMQFVSPSESGIYYVRIQSEDANFENIYDSVGKFGPNDTVIFVDNEINWRKTLYYFPEYEIYSYQMNLSSGDPLKEVLYYKNGNIEIAKTETYKIKLNSSTTKILWIVDSDSELFRNIQSKIEIKTIILPDGQKVYYSDVINNTNFEIHNLVFKVG